MWTNAQMLAAKTDTIATQTPRFAWTRPGRTRANAMPGTSGWTDSSAPIWTSVRAKIRLAMCTPRVPIHPAVTAASARRDTKATDTRADVS